jgi:hypothetical protein
MSELGKENGEVEWLFQGDRVVKVVEPDSNTDSVGKNSGFAHCAILEITNMNYHY